MAKKAKRAKASSKTATKKTNVRKQAMRAKSAAAPARKTKPAAIQSKKAKPPKVTSARPQPQRSKALATGYQWLNAHLTVRDIQEAINFYEKAFGFRTKFAMPGPDGKIMHAEMAHNDSTLMLGPENPERGAMAPRDTSSVVLYAYVENVDDVASRASSNGGKLVKPPTDE